MKNAQLFSAKTRVDQIKWEENQIAQQIAKNETFETASKATTSSQNERLQKLSEKLKEDLDLKNLNNKS